MNVDDFEKEYWGDFVKHVNNGIGKTALKRPTSASTLYLFYCLITFLANEDERNELKAISVFSSSEEEGGMTTIDRYYPARVITFAESLIDLSLRKIYVKRENIAFEVISRLLQDSKMIDVSKTFTKVQRQYKMKKTETRVHSIIRFLYLCLENLIDDRISLTYNDENKTGIPCFTDKMFGGFLMFVLSYGENSDISVLKTSCVNCILRGLECNKVFRCDKCNQNDLVCDGSADRDIKEFLLRDCYGVEDNELKDLMLKMGKVVWDLQKKISKEVIYNKVQQIVNEEVEIPEEHASIGETLLLKGKLFFPTKSNQTKEQVVEQFKYGVEGEPDEEVEEEGSSSENDDY